MSGMAVWKVALSLLKKQKAYGVTIFALSLVVALMLSAALTVMKQSGTLQRTAFENAGCPDILYVYPESQYDAELPAFIGGKAEVESVRVEEGLSVDRRCISFNGFEPQEWLHVLPHSPDQNAYRVLPEGDAAQTPGKGEILVPLLYEDYFSLKLGDTVSIGGHSFTVAGFFEDPLFGSPMIGTRRAYVNKSDFKKLQADSGDESGMYKRVHLSVYVRAESGSSDYAAQIKQAADGVSLGGNGFMISAPEIRQYSMMVPDLVAALLFSIALLSMLITLYILRYAVLSSIEGSFVTLGIFKAVGFTGGQIRMAVMQQYTLVSFVASVAGVFASIPVIPFVGGLLMDAAGLLWMGGLWIPAGLIVIFVTIALICGITWLNTRKIRKISPVRAIAFGRAPVYFAKRLNVSLKYLSALPLHMRMALKQMMTRRKQYTVLIVIVLLLTFLTTFTGAMSALFHNDKTVIKVFGYPETDIYVGLRNYQSDRHDELMGKLNQVVAEIGEAYQPVIVFELDYLNIYTEGVLTRAMVYDTFDGIGLIDPLSGRFPKYDNELALSPVMAERFGKGVGDTVYLQDINGESVPFIVTGIVQCMNEVGQNISITEAGVKRIAPEHITLTRAIIFPDGTDRVAASEKIKSAYHGDDITVSTLEEDGLKQVIDSVRSIIDPATAISYGLTVILIALITFLLAMIALYRENADIGIFKSTGFTSRQLRAQFALRFLLVSLTGGLLGVVLSLLVSDALISFVFSFFGVPKVHLTLEPVNLLLPVALVCALALMAAWLVSGQIKRVSGKVLMTE